jgi:hypothetical protein
MADIPEGIVMLSGKPFPTRPYVLNKAHEAGLLQIDTELLQIPNAQNGNVAIVKATVTLKGEPENLIFSAHGDASPANVKSHMVSAIIRLAETRATGRALRDSVNVGQTLLEEMPDEETAPPANPARPARPIVARHAAVGPARPDAGADAAPAAAALDPYFCAVCGVEVEEDTARGALKHFNQVLCLVHGKAELAARRAAAEQGVAVEEEE